MFESKQLRKEKQIFQELIKKFKKAYSIKHEETAITDTFTIDNNFVIVCTMDGTLTVSRKDTEEKIISLDCKWHNDTDSQTRYKLLRDFCNFAKNASYNFATKTAKAEEQEKAKRAEKQAQEQQNIYMKKLDTALEKLR